MVGRRIAGVVAIDVVELFGGRGAGGIHHRGMGAPEYIPRIALGPAGGILRLDEVDHPGAVGLRRDGAGILAWLVSLPHGHTGKRARDRIRAVADLDLADAIGIPDAGCHGDRPTAAGNGRVLRDLVDGGSHIRRAPEVDLAPGDRVDPARRTQGPWNLEKVTAGDARARGVADIVITDAEQGGAADLPLRIEANPVGRAAGLAARIALDPVDLVVAAAVPGDQLQAAVAVDHLVAIGRAARADMGSLDPPAAGIAVEGAVGDHIGAPVGAGQLDIVHDRDALSHQQHAEVRITAAVLGRMGEAVFRRLVGIIAGIPGGRHRAIALGVDLLER